MTTTPAYWLTRFVVLRLLGLVYLVAFLVFCMQGLPLIGSDGLLPAADYLQRVAAHAGSRLEGFRLLPSVFWLDVSDRALMSAGWCGVALSLLVAFGFANAIVMAILWALYLSIVHVGQLWYGYGWETQLCETGFLAMFLCPLLDGRPFPRRPPPTVIIWLLRWLTFRIMLGAGLIKLRGDPCWRDLTCLEFHYQTQPIPSPLSRWFHFAPVWVHEAGVLFNHLAELVAPWFVFWPRLARHVAGTVLVAFQVTLILSGNLSFLNWLTIVPVLACFDDGLLRHVLPRRLVVRAQRAAADAVPSRGMQLAALLYAAVVVVLSVAPVENLMSSHQAMNTSFDPLELVNTYGAFGSVGRVRNEIVFEGTRDEVVGPDTVWEEYEFPCKPGDPMRRPCLITPYHYRLDWQIWFAAMASPAQYPWTVHFAWKLLHADPGVRELLARDPFGDSPPHWVRALLYRYEFAPPDDPGGAWWRRTVVGEWLPPLRADDPALLRFMRQHGWKTSG
jgi:hypothetical protein